MSDAKDERIEFLEWENALLKEIIDNINEGVFAVNDKEEIILYSKRVEQIEGMRREAVLGKTEREVYSAINKYCFDSFNRQVKHSNKPILDKIYNYVLPDGRTVHLLSSILPFVYKGNVTAVYSIGNDIMQSDKFISKTLEVQHKMQLGKTEEYYKAAAKYYLDDIIGSSEKMIEVVALSRRIATHKSPVLIVGETGVGKELIAQGIHNASTFNQGPFVAINCAAIPDNLLEGLLFGTIRGSFTGATDRAGLFEQGKNGTVFLDEINSLPLHLQPKLLRVLQEKVVRRIGSDKEICINCRIISATNQDPFASTNVSTIRMDLLYRLATVVINIPPLRERGSDIKSIASYFLDQFNNEYGLRVRGFSEDVLELFESYSWPGNIRELRNVIESALNMVDQEVYLITMKHIPTYYQKRLMLLKSKTIISSEHKGTLKDIKQTLEKEFIENALKENNWNVSRTASKLGILRQNLHQKIRKLNILRNDQ